MIVAFAVLVVFILLCVYILDDLERTCARAAEQHDRARGSAP